LFICVAMAAEADAGERTREIEALVRRADFDVAERAARKLLQSGSLSRHEVARVYLQLGIIASAKRDAAGGAAAFRNALRLDGELTLHASAGPHVAQTFARVKSSIPAADSATPAITLRAVPGQGELAIEAAPRPEGPARRVSVRIAEREEARDLGAEPLRFSLQLPASVDGCATATASVLDEFGNELWPAVASQEVCRPPPIAAAPADVDNRPVSLVVRPRSPTPSSNVLSTGASPVPTSAPRALARASWTAAAMTGAAAVGTAVLGIVALERGNEYKDSLGGSASYEQQRQLRELAETAQSRATAGAIVTGALAVTTAVLYIWGRF
jgi:hypothetical protein